MTNDLLEKIRVAAESDPELLVEKGAASETLGHNPDYLFDVHGITKSDLIRLERAGFALKARYEVTSKNKRYISKEALRDAKPVTGTHRTRWILFRKENE